MSFWNRILPGRGEESKVLGGDEGRGIDDDPMVSNLRQGTTILRQETNHNHPPHTTFSNTTSTDVESRQDQRDPPQPQPPSPDSNLPSETLETATVAVAMTSHHHHSSSNSTSNSGSGPPPTMNVHFHPKRQRPVVSKQQRVIAPINQSSSSSPVPVSMTESVMKETILETMTTPNDDDDKTDTTMTQRMTTDDDKKPFESIVSPWSEHVRNPDEDFVIIQPHNQDEEEECRRRMISQTSMDNNATIVTDDRPVRGDELRVVVEPWMLPKPTEFTSTITKICADDPTHEDGMVESTLQVNHDELNTSPLQDDPPVTTTQLRNDPVAVSTELVIMQQHTPPCRPPQQETQLALIHSPPPNTNSRFVFASDEKHVPSQLQTLGQATMRRRHQFQSRIHTLECQLATLTASLAQETMDRETTWLDFMSSNVYQPLEATAERLFVEQRQRQQQQQYDRMIMMKQPHESRQSHENESSSTIRTTANPNSDSVNHSQESTGTTDARTHGDDDDDTYIKSMKTTTTTTTIMGLERRLSQLDCRMTTHIHKDMFHIKRETLETLQDQLLHEMIPEFQLEASKADKREGSMNRRWEMLVGSMFTRRYLEERTSRQASLMWMKEELQQVLQKQEQDDMVVLTKLQELRATFEQNRTERVAADQQIRNLISDRAITLQRVLLETLDPIM